VGREIVAEECGAVFPLGTDWGGLWQERKLL